ncbi:MAG: hypothetical protein WC632_03980 [Candidatus Margulisiibacteriota bacterium]
MKKIRLLKGGMAVLLAWLVFSGPVLAIATIRNPIVKKGGSAVSNALIQAIEGAVASTGSGTYYSGTLRAFGITDASGIWQTSTSIQDGSSFYLKGWSDNPPALGKYYGFNGPYQLGTAKDTNDVDDKLINLDHKAAAPQTPYINNISETTAHPYDSGHTPLTTVSNLIVSSSPHAVDDGIREVSSMDWSWGQDPNKLTLDPNQHGASLILPSTTLTPGGTYYFEVVYNGPFGNSPPCATLGYTLGAGGVGGGVTSLTITLKKKTDGMGVNSIGMPFDGPLEVQKEDGTSILTGVATLGDLIKAVNATETAKVTAAAYWDESQQLFGATYDSGGNKLYVTPSGDPAALTLKAGKGYYLSVDKDVTIKLKK